MPSVLSRIGGYAKLLLSAELDEVIWRLRVKILGLDFRVAPIAGPGARPSRGDYSDSGGKLKPVLKALKPPRSGHAIDVGCGKAGAVATLARYFATADGVDISPSLIAAGRENLRRMRIRNASLFVSDAAEFHDLDRYSFIYFYNPFPRLVMERVVHNMVASLRRHPRRLDVLYLNPYDGDVLEAAGFVPTRTFPLKGGASSCVAYSCTLLKDIP